MQDKIKKLTQNYAATTQCKLCGLIKSHRYDLRCEKYVKHQEDEKSSESPKEKDQHVWVEQVDPYVLEAYLMPALDTVIECRRYLAWTYPIAFYMHEHFPKNDLFIDLQTKLTSYMEQLQGLCEQDVAKCVTCDGKGKLTAQLQATTDDSKFAKTAEADAAKKAFEKMREKDKKDHEDWKTFEERSCECCNANGKGALYYKKTHERIRYLTHTINTFRDLMVVQIEEIIEDQGIDKCRKCGVQNVKDVNPECVTNRGVNPKYHDFVGTEAFYTRE